MKEITLVVDEKWFEAIKNLTNDIYEEEVCVWNKVRDIGYRYVFTCEPEECDTMIVVTPNQEYDFPSGKVSMKCPCGREMNYITKEYY